MPDTCTTPVPGWSDSAAADRLARLADDEWDDPIAAAHGQITECIRLVTAQAKDSPASFVDTLGLLEMARDELPEMRAALAAAKGRE